MRRWVLAGVNMSRGFGANPEADRRGGCTAQRSPAPPSATAQAVFQPPIDAQESCVDVLRKLIIVVALNEFTTPIILSVIPPFPATGEALAGQRALSSMHVDLAAEVGSAFIDVEALLSASPEGDDAGRRAREDLILIDSDDEALAR